MLQRQLTFQNMNKSFTKGENKGYLAVWTFSRLLVTFYEDILIFETFKIFAERTYKHVFDIVLQVRNNK